MTNKNKEGTMVLQRSSRGTDTLYLRGGRLRVLMGLVAELGDNRPMFTDTPTFWANYD